MASKKLLTFVIFKILKAKNLSLHGWNLLISAWKMNLFDAERQKADSLMWAAKNSKQGKLLSEILVKKLSLWICIYNSVF